MAVATQVKIQQNDATPALESNFFNDYKCPEMRSAYICDGMLSLVATIFDVSVRELRAPGRCCERVSRVRQVAMYVTHVALQLTMADIGKGFGRNRTTVLYACQVIEDMREEGEFDHLISRIERTALAAFSTTNDNQY